MFATSFVTGLNLFYIVLMALVSLVGTTALLKLIASLVNIRPHRALPANLEPEDA